MNLHYPEHCPKQEIVSSIDELWTLFSAAYEQYQSEILKDGKLYDRYVNDFISYHLPVFSKDEVVVRKHFRNVFSLYELLTNRKDLVRKYFTPLVFEKKDFEEMLYSFNHQACVVENPQFLASFNENQIRLITQFANESNLFVSHVDEKTIDMFFRCKLVDGLVVNNMAEVLPFLYELSRQRMIPHNWVSLIATNKLLIPKRTMEPSSRVAISHRLTELKESIFGFPGMVHINLVKRLKEML